jgi:hypothetical protein
MLHKALLELFNPTMRKKRRQERRDEQRYQQWQKSGKPVPPPHIVKRRAVEEYARRSKATCFIETGTWRGDMVASVLESFKRIYSIELDEVLCEKARQRFAGNSHVSILYGDSATVLPQVLSKVNETCLFWLDGHYSGNETSKGIKETPVIEELTGIFAHPIQNHAILIDDAREFASNKEYPSLETVRTFVVDHGKGYGMEVRDDMVIIVRDGLRSST